MLDDDGFDTYTPKVSTRTLMFLIALFNGKYIMLTKPLNKTKMYFCLICLFKLVSKQFLG